MKRNKVAAVLVITAGLAVIILTIRPSLQRINEFMSVDYIKQSIEQFGIAAPIVYIAFNIVSVIVSPLVVTPFWIAGIIVFQPNRAFFYIYTASMLGHIINFSIARTWGRDVIQHFTGKKGLKEIGKYSDIVEWKMVICIRILGAAASDYISYALGLTDLPFNQYVVITMTTGFIWISGNFYFLYKALIQNNLAVMARNFGFLTLLSYFLMAILSYILYNKREK